MVTSDEKINDYEILLRYIEYPALWLLHLND